MNIEYKYLPSAWDEYRIGFMQNKEFIPLGIAPGEVAAKSITEALNDPEGTKLVSQLLTMSPKNPENRDPVLQLLQQHLNCCLDEEEEEEVRKRLITRKVRLKELAEPEEEEFEITGKLILDNVEDMDAEEVFQKILEAVKHGIDEDYED